MELHKKEKEKKHALALIREEQKLWRQKNSIIPIKLEKPIHHGYVRTLELREDIKQRGDYATILNVVKFLGQTKVYHKNKDFINYTRKTAHELHAGLKSFTDPRFRFYRTDAARSSDIEKLESFEKYLNHHISIFTCSCDNPTCESRSITPKFRPHYTFKFPWMLQEKTSPYYLTHYTPVQSEIESRLSEIGEEIRNNNYYEKYIFKKTEGDRIFKSSLLNIKYNDDKSIIYHSLADLNEEWDS